MPTTSDGPPRELATRALREAIGRDGLDDLIDDLAAERVRWSGPGPGGACRTRADVRRTLKNQVELGMRPRLRAVRPVKDRVLLEVELSPDNTDHTAIWVVATLDDAGRIIELQDYATEAAADHDLSLAGTGTTRTPPTTRVGRLAPLVQVSDVARSVSFYALLGFNVTATHEEDGRWEWAALKAADSTLMLAQADGDVNPGNETVTLYLYADDLTALRDHLVAHGTPVGPIIDAPPAPRLQMRVTDPDGYSLMIALPRSPT